MADNFLSFLFNGSPPPNATTQTSTTSTIPPYIQAYSQANLSKADALAANPYQTYTGPRVAGFSDPTNQSFALTQANQGNWQSPLNQATAMTQSAGSTGVDQSVLNQYLSPYISGVTDRIAQLGQRNLTENLLPSVNQSFAGSGQWGSSRHADFTNNAVRDANESILGQQSLALQQAQDSAMSNYQTAQNRSLNAGQQLGALAGQQQQYGAQDAASLSAIGAQQEAKTQQNLDVAYQDFQNQQQYPKDQVNWLSNLVTGQPMSSTQTTTSAAPASTYQPSALSQMSGLYSLFNGLSGKKRGGRVSSLRNLQYA